MAGDADSDSNIKQNPDSSAGDNVERAETGDASSRESAESSDARSNLSNEAVREFENSNRAGNSSVAAESQARQDTASEHLPSITIEDKQSQANQATSERQSQRETSEDSRQSTTANQSAEQQPQQAQSGDQQTQHAGTTAESGRQSTGDAQTPTGDQQLPQGLQQAQSGDQQTQTDATAAETGRQATGDQQAQTPEQQAQSAQVQDQQRQSPDQQSQNQDQHNQSRDQQAPANDQQTEFSVQQAQHESEHDREQQSDDQQNQSEQQQDQRQSGAENQTEQKPESTDNLPETDSWDFNVDNSNQDQDQREQQNEEQSPGSDTLPETDSWDFGNTNNDNQDQQQRDDQATDKLPEVDDWNFGNTNNENQEQDQRDDQATDKLPEVDDWNFGDQTNHDEAPTNTLNENNRTEHDGDTTQIPNTESGGPNTDVGVPNHEGASNQQGSLNEGSQNNLNGSANNASANVEEARSNSGTSERSESLERQASSENVDTRSLSASTDSSSNVQNRVADPLAQNVENASKSESPVSTVGQNQDTLERNTVPGDNNIQSVPVAESRSPVSESENNLAARTASEPAQVDSSVAQNNPKEVEKQDQRDSNPVAPLPVAGIEKGESNAPATPQADGDDSPSPTAKDSKPESQERESLPANQGFVQPTFVASAANPAATQARVDAQLASMPIRPLTSGFLEKASSDRSANALALNSKSFPGKFAGEQSKIGKDGKPVGADRKSFEGNKGLDGRQGPFDPRFGGISKVEGKAARILKRRLATSGEKHYLTGIEIALAAAITAAAIAKKRNGVSDDQAAGEIAESQLAELLGDLSADSTKKNAQDSAMYRSAVNHFKRPTHLVQPNESLTSISEDYFGDSDIAWLIADINAGLINEHFEDGRRIVELNSRVEIELPLPSEITDFFTRKQKEQKGDLIITIIKESEVDSELLNSFLGNVVGIGTGAIAPVREPVALSQLTSTVKMAAASAAPVSMNAVMNSGEKLNTFVSQFGLPKLSVNED